MFCCTYIIFLLSPVHPVSSLGVLTGTMPEAVLDRKLQIAEREFQCESCEAFCFEHIIMLLIFIWKSLAQKLRTPMHLQTFTMMLPWGAVLLYIGLPAMNTTAQDINIIDMWQFIKHSTWRKILLINRMSWTNLTCITDIFVGRVKLFLNCGKFFEKFEITEADTI